MTGYYTIASDPNRYASLDDIEDDTVGQLEALHPLAKKWKALSYEDQTGLKQGDFPHCGPVPALSKRALQVLSAFIPKKVEILPFEFSGEEHYFLHFTERINALDLKKSKINRYPDGRVITVVNAVLIPAIAAGHHMFKTPEDTWITYISDEAKEAIAKNKLKGAVIKEIAP